MAKELLEKRAFRPARSRRAIWVWREMVGPQLATRSEPYRVEGQTLFVRVPSAPWAEELFLMKATILKRLAERLGRNAVKDIRFEVARPARPSHGRARRRAEKVAFPELGGMRPGDGWPDGPLGDALTSAYQHAAERGRSSRSSTSEATSSSVSKTLS